MGFPFGDNFDRANENPILAPWASPIRPGNDECRIITNELGPGTTSGTSSSYLNLDTYLHPDSRLRVRNKGVAGTSYHTHHMRISAPNTAGVDSYSMDVNNLAGTDTFAAFRMVNNVVTSLGTLGSQEVAVGDTTRFVVWGFDPVILRAYIDIGTTGVWTLVGEIQDSNAARIRDAGFVGVEMNTTNGTQRVDNFFVDEFAKQHFPGRRHSRMVSWA